MYLHSEAGSLVRSLWEYVIESGERRIVAGPEGASKSLSREEELQRERTRTRELGVSDYSFAKKAEVRTILIPGGPLLRLLRGGVLRGDQSIELPGTEGALDARISADGGRVSFLRAGNSGRSMWSGRRTGARHDN